MLVFPLISPPHKGPYSCCCFIPLYNNILAAVTYTHTTNANELSRDDFEKKNEMKILVLLCRVKVT